MGRRRFLGLAGAGVMLAAGSGGPQLLSSPTSTGTVLDSAVRLPAPFARPLPIPAVAMPVGRGPDGDRYEITAREATADILPVARTPIWGYDGTFPGPTVETRSGRPAIIRHRNELPVPTVVHLHGGHTPPESDGFPTDLVLPGRGGWSAEHATMHDPTAVVTRGVREYLYPQAQPATTLWAPEPHHRPPANATT